jgi:hypothetical protein
MSVERLGGVRQGVGDMDLRDVYLIIRSRLRDR